MNSKDFESFCNQYWNCEDPCKGSCPLADLKTRPCQEVFSEMQEFFLGILQ